MSARAERIYAGLVGFNDLDDLAAAPPDLVRGWLPQGGFAVIYGEPGTGKSFFAVDLAVHVALDDNWHGHAVSRPEPQSGAIYVAAEGGRGMVSRLRAISVGWPEPVDPLNAFACLPMSVDLHEGADASAIIEATERLPVGVGMIAIDTISRAMGSGHENDTRDMQRVVANCNRITEETGATVVLLHHAGKLGDIRGSTVLMGAVDAAIRVTRRDGVSTATVEKMRDGPDGAKFHFALKPVEVGRRGDGEPITSAVVQPCDPPRQAPPRGKRGGDADGLRARERIAIDALAAAEKAFPQPENGESVPCVPLERWREECLRRNLAPSANPATQRTAFFKVKKSLENKGIVEIDGDFVRRVSR